MNTLASIIVVGSLLTFVSINACTKNDVPDDVLNISKTPYLGKELRIDGYFYTKYNNQMLDINFLYENGVLSNFSGGNRNSFEEMEAYIKDPETLTRVKNTKFSWGLFIIDSNDIKIDHWVPSEGVPSKQAFTRIGKIINDTAIVFTESYRLQNGQKSKYSKTNRLYYFKQYEPKPDSANNFLP